MKVTIIKFLSKKGKIIEMDKSKLSVMPDSIIDEYIIEIDATLTNEDTKHQELKDKYDSGDYVAVALTEDSNINCHNVKTIIAKKGDLFKVEGINSTFTPPKIMLHRDNGITLTNMSKYKLIHTKHQQVLEYWLNGWYVEWEFKKNKWTSTYTDSFVDAYKEETNFRVQQRNYTLQHFREYVDELNGDGDKMFIVYKNSLSKGYQFEYKEYDNIILGEITFTEKTAERVCKELNDGYLKIEE